MSNQENNGEKPEFRMQKMYLKDFSYENPNAPEIFQPQGKAEPNVELNIKLNNRKINDVNYEVSLVIDAKVTSKLEGGEEKTMFIIEVEHAGLFRLKNIPEEHLRMVLAVDCPTLLFPFTRQIVSQVSQDGGFIPFQMEPINFMALFQNAQNNQQNAQA